MVSWIFQGVELVHDAILERVQCSVGGCCGSLEEVGCFDGVNGVWDAQARVANVAKRESRIGMKRLGGVEMGRDEEG